MRITVLSPHRDDAAFSAGLAIGVWLRAGHTVRVVNCFTRSEYCPFGDNLMVHPNDLRSYVTALRHREDLHWSRLYPRPVELNDLNLRDAPLRLPCSLPEVCSIAPRPAEPAFTKIRTSLHQSAPDALLLPLAIGTHVDHLTARIAAYEGWPPQQPIAFYEDLPYAARLPHPECIPQLACTVNEQLNASFASRPADADAALQAALQAKRRMALCYDSQIDDDTTELIAGFCLQYGGRERLWANAAWQQSGLAA